MKPTSTTQIHLFADRPTCPGSTSPFSRISLRASVLSSTCLFSPSYLHRTLNEIGGEIWSDFSQREDFHSSEHLAVEFHSVRRTRLVIAFGSIKFIRAESFLDCLDKYRELRLVLWEDLFIKFYLLQSYRRLFSDWKWFPYFPNLPCPCCCSDKLIFPLSIGFLNSFRIYPTSPRPTTSSGLSSVLYALLVHISPLF